MKYSLVILFVIFSFCAGFGSCDERVSNTTNTPHNNNSNNDTMGNKLKIKLGSGTFTATLLNNETATAFKAMLPITIDMTELNGNEKYYDLPKSLPTNSAHPQRIQNGDIMLFDSKTLVLFYKTFQSSYSYTKLGSVNDASRLAAALGSGNVTVTFEME